MKSKAVITVGLIKRRIFIIRGLKVMVDREIAELYGVETKQLNRQVKRNRDRFPNEFVFQLTKKEKEELVTNRHRFEMLKHSSTLPYVFTEHGIAMLATVIKSQQAVRMSILSVKAFVRLLEILTTHKDLAEKLEVLEAKLNIHDKEIQTIIEAIHQLLQPAEKPKQQIGFRVSDNTAVYSVKRKR